MRSVGSSRRAQPRVPGGGKGGGRCGGTRCTCLRGTAGADHTQPRAWEGKSEGNRGGNSEEQAAQKCPSCLS